MNRLSPFLPLLALAGGLALAAGINHSAGSSDQVHASDVESCELEAITGPRTQHEGDGPAWVEDARGVRVATFQRWGDAVLFVDAACAEPH